MGLSLKYVLSKEKILLIINTESITPTNNAQPLLLIKEKLKTIMKILVSKETLNFPAFAISISSLVNVFGSSITLSSYL
ncbi:hypothetical protein AWJ11_16830 (plasmid) [Piscirickettsia salmonis]|nr:hypothetical protein AWJ11_16830 [Piscirickettsia salmonis]